MRPLIKNSARIILSLAFVFAMFSGIAWVISSIWEELISIDAKLAIGIVAAFATVIGATLTVTLGKYLERKQDVQAHFRDRKVEMYDEFLNEFFKLFYDHEDKPDQQLVAYLQEWQRMLVVWGGSNVLTTYVKWKNHLSTRKPDAESMFLMGDFLLAIRKDLGLSNKGIDRKTFVHLILKNADLFLVEASKNPLVTMEEIAAIEARLGE